MIATHMKRAQSARGRGPGNQSEPSPRGLELGPGLNIQRCRVSLVSCAFFSREPGESRALSFWLQMLEIQTSRERRRDPIDGELKRNDPHLQHLPR